MDKQGLGNSSDEEQKVSIKPQRHEPNIFGKGRRFSNFLNRKSDPRWLAVRNVYSAGSEDLHKKTALFSRVVYFQA
jgi:hypothetical protein